MPRERQSHEDRLTPFVILELFVIRHGDSSTRKKIAQMAIYKYWKKSLFWNRFSWIDMFQKLTMISVLNCSKIRHIFSIYNIFFHLLFQNCINENKSERTTECKMILRNSSGCSFIISHVTKSAYYRFGSDSHTLCNNMHCKALFFRQFSS